MSEIGGERGCDIGMVSWPQNRAGPRAGFRRGLGAGCGPQASDLKAERRALKLNWIS